jgi:hypothetical protein
MDETYKIFQYGEIRNKNSFKFSGHLSECCGHNIGTPYACKSDIKFKYWEEAIEWCRTSMYSNEYLIVRMFHDEGEIIEFCFKSEDHAMAFKLKWL